MKRKGLILGTIGIIGMFAIIAVVTITILYPAQNDVWDINAKKLKNSLNSLEDSTVIEDLSTVTPFEWDTIYSFTPYISKEKVYDIVGYKWDYISETVSEGMNQIVFLKDNKVVCYVYGYSSNLKYGFNLGVHRESYIKYTSDQKLTFKLTTSGTGIKYLQLEEVDGKKVEELTSVNYEGKAKLNSKLYSLELKGLRDRDYFIYFIKDEMTGNEILKGEFIKSNSTVIEKLNTWLSIWKERQVTIGKINWKNLNIEGINITGDSMDITFNKELSKFNRSNMDPWYFLTGIKKTVSQIDDIKYINILENGKEIRVLGQEGIIVNDMSVPNLHIGNNEEKLFFINKEGITKWEELEGEVSVNRIVDVWFERFKELSKKNRLVDYSNFMINETSFQCGVLSIDFNVELYNLAVDEVALDHFLVSLFETLDSYNELEEIRILVEGQGL